MAFFVVPVNYDLPPLHLGDPCPDCGKDAKCRVEGLRLFQCWHCWIEARPNTLSVREDEPNHCAGCGVEIGPRASMCRSCAGAIGGEKTAGRPRVSKYDRKGAFTH